MASSNVSSFIQRVGQGVKPNMFMVDVNFPGSLSKSADDLETTNIMCKSAALPGSNLGVIEVPFRGRTVKIAGDRTFDTWTATFFADSNMEIRGLFEDWANSINSHEGNTAERFLPNQGTTGYMADLFVSQLEKDDQVGGSVIRTYQLHHCFPTNVSAIDLAYDSNDQISEFTVEWQYSFFTAGVGLTSKATGTSLSEGASTRDVV
jgi:hypothetical protein